MILLLEFVAFTFAMYAVFLATPGPAVSGFSNLGQSMLTMFNLMVGMSEIDVLNDAANPWLAITLYALFVVFTYLVALNSLIAMMSHTCTLVFTDKVVVVTTTTMMMMMMIVIVTLLLLLLLLMMMMMMMVVVVVVVKMLMVVVVIKMTIVVVVEVGVVILMIMMETK